MKKILFYILLLFIFYPLSTFASFQNQGFVDFKENNNKINFECEKQCLAVIDKFNFNDFIKIIENDIQ